MFGDARKTIDWLLLTSIIIGSCQTKEKASYAYSLIIQGVVHWCKTQGASAPPKVFIS